MIPKRKPTAPGEILSEEFLKPLEMTQLELARKIGKSTKEVSLIVNGKMGITATWALLLSEVFKTNPEFWTNLQSRVKIYEAMQKLNKRKQKGKKQSI